jgi:putative sigma-54 modulation protein
MAIHLPLTAKTLVSCLSVQSRGLSLTTPFRCWLAKTMTGALGRFAYRIQAIHIWLEDVNGPRGGIDVRCRIEVKFQSQGRISVSALAADEYAATAKAAIRAREQVDRRIKRARSRRRQLTRA